MKFLNVVILIGMLVAVTSGRVCSAETDASSFDHDSAIDPRLKLTTLKPERTRAKKLGRVSGFLLNAANERVLDRISASVGDCETCARGIAVKGVLGVRFEGDRLSELRIVKKSGRGVLYRECKQDQLSRKTPYTCTFTFGSATYTLKLQPR